MQLCCNKETSKQQLSSSVRPRQPTRRVVIMQVSHSVSVRHVCFKLCLVVGAMRADEGLQESVARKEAQEQALAMCDQADALSAEGDYEGHKCMDNKLGYNVVCFI